MFSTDKFHFVIEYNDRKVEEYGMGESYLSVGGDFLHNPNSTGEWGYATFYLDGLFDGRAKKVGPSFWYKGKPETREEAYERMVGILKDFLKEHGDEKESTSMNGHFPWHHYAGIAGFKVLGTEIGENISYHQMKLAINRGAAKQYGTPWFVDYSQWFGGYILCYDADDGTKNFPSSKYGGHDISTMERSLLLAFMMGADATIAEAGAGMCFRQSGEITPYGYACRRLNEFTGQYSKKLKPFVPFGLILDRYNGMALDGEHNIYNTFDREEYDWFTYDVLHKILWKVPFEGSYEADAHQMVNTKYGELFDVFFPDVDESIMAEHKALIFLGGIKLSAEEKKKYIDYVSNGGILLLNTAYADIFEELGVMLPRTVSGKSLDEIKLGKGSFIVFGEGTDDELVRYDPYDETILDMNFINSHPDIKEKLMNGEMMKAGNWSAAGFDVALDELYERFVPFSFSEDIGYTISETEDAYYVYVFNNAGIIKKINKPVVINEKRAVGLEINYNGEGSILSAEDIYNHHQIESDGKKMKLRLKAGDFAVIRMKK